MKSVLITGASGHLGSVMRQRLAAYFDEVRISDIQPITGLAEHEAFYQMDLSDFESVKVAMDGVEAVVHFGGVSIEGRFDAILNANIHGAYNVYEAARQLGSIRVIFASSNHTVGFYQRSQMLDSQMPFRPDSLYGVSKCFGENLAQYYYDKFGVESGLLRIGSCTPEPEDYRMLATWLSYGDLESLIMTCINAPKLKCTPVFATSNNDHRWWDNKHAAFLGWAPKDNSADYLHLAKVSPDRVDRNDPSVQFQGGLFATAGHFED